MDDLIAQIDGHRVKQGMSITDLAAACGINRSNLSKILNGHVDPQWSTVVSITQALDLGLHCDTASTTTSTAGRAR